MKTTTPIAMLLLVLAGGTAAHADHPWRHNHLGLSLHRGSYELEGPAVAAVPGGEDLDVTMFGLRVEGHMLLGDAWYARGVVDLSRLDGDAGLLQAHVSIGTIRALAKRDAWKLDGYLQAGVEYVRSSNLDRLVTDPNFDGPDGGDDIGATAEIGLSLGFRPETRVDLFTKYLTYGDGGISFGVRVSHDLNETLTLTGGLDAVWVKGADTQIDVDFHRWSIGVLRKF